MYGWEGGQLIVATNGTILSPRIFRDVDESGYAGGAAVFSNAPLPVGMLP